MRVRAKIVLDLGAGVKVMPGEETEIADTVEAERLIARGFAEVVRPAAKEGKADKAGKGGAS